MNNGNKKYKAQAGFCDLILEAKETGRKQGAIKELETLIKFLTSKEDVVVEEGYLGKYLEKRLKVFGGKHDD